MKLSIGIDIEQSARFKRKNRSFLKKFLSEREIKAMNGYSAQRIAGIFCAKEAVIKACNQIQHLNFKNIEVLHDEYGSPSIKFKGCKKLDSENIKISISHSSDYAVATAILIIN